MTKSAQSKKPTVPANIAATAIEIHRIDRNAEVSMARSKAAAKVAIAVAVFLSIRELAGKETLMTLLVNAVVDTPSRGVSWMWIVATFVMGIWAAAEHWLRLRKVDQMSGRIEELERRIDPMRTSSGLTSSGETPPIGHKK